MPPRHHTGHRTAAATPLRRPASTETARLLLTLWSAICVLPLGSFLGFVCESSCVDPRKISLGKAFLAAIPPHPMLADT